MIQSYILIDYNLEHAKEYILSFGKSHNIHPFDIFFVEDEKSLGIEQVRTLQKKILLRPGQGDVKLCATLTGSITIEAQNALLKLLEEPPDSTIVIITAKTKDVLLPTIISRCRVIEVQNDERQNVSRSIVFKDIGKGRESLFLAQTYGKDREEALIFLEALIKMLRERILEYIVRHDETTTLAKTINKAQKTHTIIKTTNVQPRFALEDLLLSSLDISNLL